MPQPNWTEPETRNQSDQVSQQDLRILLDHAPDAVGRFDRELRHVYVNEATARANNRPASDFYHKTMEDLGHSAETCATINSNLRHVFESGKERTFDIPFNGPDGSVCYQCRMAPEFDDDGEVEYVLVISRDVTEQRSAQHSAREADRLAATNNITAQLAHEVNNPLSAVVNAIYLLQRNDSLDAQGREMLHLASSNLDRVTDICKRILRLHDKAR